MKKITVQLLFCLISQYFFAQSYVWNTLGNGDKKDLFLEQNYVDELTGQEPGDDQVNPNVPINRDISIRTGEIHVESDKSVSLLMGTGGLTIENANLDLSSVENAGIDLGTGNTSFIISDATVTAEFVHNANIIMDGRSQLILDGDESCLANSTIELRSPDAFVIFSSIRPSAISSTLKNSISANDQYTQGTVRLSQHYGGLNIRANPINDYALHVFGDIDQKNYLGSFTEGFYGKIGINSGLKVENEQYEIIGFGDGISGKEDMFHFAYRKLIGNGELIARCDSVQNNNAQTKTGLMIRASLDINAPFIMVNIQPDNKVSAMLRGAYDANVTYINSATGSSATVKFLKITREGEYFAAFYSETGEAESWIQLGEQIAIPMEEESYFGLARSSSEGSLGALALFSQVSLQQNNIPVTAGSFGVFEAHTDVFKPCPLEDEIASFVLKKGYELCLSSDGAGQGYSQVWIATEEDIFINLPVELVRKNSFFRVTPWRWTSKKGWGGEGAVREMLQVSWNYEWEPTGNSTANIEFVPMIKGRAQNKDFRWEQVRKRGGQTHMLGFNEPMAAKQGDLTVDEAIELWPKEQMIGLRLGSPARTDGANGDNWLKEFMQKADAKGYRVDFICVHCYNRSTAAGLRNFLRDDYEKYGRPIWLTEFNSQLTSLSEQEKFIADVTEMMEELPFLERYAYFNSIEYKNFFNEDRTALSSVGEIYRDVKSNPAYVSPDYGKWMEVNLSATMNEQLTANVEFPVSQSAIESVTYFVNGIAVGTTSSAPFNLMPVAVSDQLISVRAVVKNSFWGTSIIQYRSVDQSFNRN